MSGWKGLLHQYRDYLPITDRTSMVSLHEGNAPLIRCDNLSADWGVDL